MNKTILARLFQSKIELNNAIIKHLPENLQSPVKHAQQEILQSAQEAIQCFLQTSNEKAAKNGSAEKTKGLKTINID